MTATTVVHLLRHGEVENPTKILYGRLPGYRLSRLGEQMAAAVAKSLADRDIGYVVSSPLDRAVQTAQPIADAHGLSVEIDQRVIESGNVFEGKRFGVGDGVLRDPRNWWALRNPFQPSWGENYFAIAARMHEALLAARDRSRGREALCVSHQLPIETLRRFTEQRRLWHDPRRRRCSLASVTSFHFADDRLVDITYTEPAAHLVARSAGARTARGA